MPITVGQTIDSRYAIYRYVASGAMADIYEAQDTILNRPVALKFLKEKYLENDNYLEQFKNEARFAAIFSHINILKIYNVGEYESRPYISYELLKGKTLKEVLDYRGNISLDEAIDYMIQILTGVNKIHELGITHNDLKPDNLFLLVDGTIRICDFGISSHFSSKEQNQIQGTVNYLAPEVVKYKKYSPQSDLYSLGIVFYEFLTGELPFEGDNSEEVLKSHLSGKVISTKSSLLNNYNPDIDFIINKAIDINVNARYKSANEFIDDLNKIKSHTPINKKTFFGRLFKWLVM